MAKQILLHIIYLIHLVQFVYKIHADRNDGIKDITENIWVPENDNFQLLQSPLIMMKSLLHTGIMSINFRSRQ